MGLAWRFDASSALTRKEVNNKMKCLDEFTDGFKHCDQKLKVLEGKRQFRK